MKRLISILYLLLCILYPLLCFEMFEDWNSNVLILSIPLLAIGAWLFGSTRGLFIIIYVESISFAISQFYADEYAYFSDRATGMLIALLVVYLFSRLRINFDGTREISQQLDARVTQRDFELSTLTEQLLRSSENRRVNRGQELHDGIGQQLTGVQLLCSSLTTQLKNEASHEASTANALMEATHRAHNHIRQISRALFPVRIAQVGLVSALIELAACINEIRMLNIQVKELSDVSGIPESIALQLYRICQECINYLINHANADQLDVTVNTSAHHFVLGVAHNGSPQAMTQKDSLFGLIQYRLKQINGTQAESKTLQGLSIIYFKVPKPQN